ncbi:hypothetical protein [Nostoc sp.]|uniref:hypothetical protein n=1 Tax=Nostoc sp. TaxID=1180 RepID=UPI002FFB1767
MKSAEFRVLLADSYGLARAELKDHPLSCGVSTNLLSQEDSAYKGRGLYQVHKC